MSITFTDLFAGAGGSSTGAEQAGARGIIAANHWDLAVSTHQENHPGMAHDLADLSQVDPRRYPHTDMLLASPECTHHSNAAGKARDGDAQQAQLFGEKPLPVEAYERSRATMWDVVRFSEYHRYPVVVVENVVEATRWAPFRAWIQAMESLGYQHEIVCHNAMHAQALGAPAPQSRDRLFVTFWDRKMPRPDWDRVQRPKAWCPRCDRTVESAKAWKRIGNTIGKYRSQYIYVCQRCGRQVEPGWLPAASAIDWSDLGTPIGERKRPLSEKTLARIREGLSRWREAMLIPVEGRPGKKAQPASNVMRTLTCRNETGLLMPYYGSSEGCTTTDKPMGTLTTRDRYALVTLRGHNAPKPVTSVMDTISAGGNHNALADVSVKDINECRFRMMTPEEDARGMAFPESYIWHGTKRERVKLAGNAVCPPIERDLVSVAMDALAA
jgi:DNA (cytosine-5)-methyltransferase 1